MIQEKHCWVPHQPLSQQCTQGQIFNSNNLQNTSAAHHLRMLYNFWTVKKDLGELKYGICMEIVYLSSFTTCFVDNNPYCFGIPLGNKAKCSNISSNFHFIFSPSVSISALCSSDLNFTCYCMPWTVIFQSYNNFLFSRPRKGAGYPICAFCLVTVQGWPSDLKKKKKKKKSQMASLTKLLSEAQICLLSAQ